MTNDLNSFVSMLFVAKLTTGGMSICTSIYSMIFVSLSTHSMVLENRFCKPTFLQIRGENWIELFIYVSWLLFNIFDIFMIMHYGNEIKFASSHLPYHLYESNWIDRSQSIRHKIVIFNEMLLQPHQLFVLDIFSLTLQTFMRVSQQ